MRKKIFLIFVSLMIILLPKLTEAAEFNEAEEKFICALSSMAAYESDNAILVRGMLTSYGWTITSMYDENSKANEKVLVVSKTFEDGSLVKILSVCGTSEIKDAEVDFRVQKVEHNPIKNNVLVHQGFKDYADVILKNDLEKNLLYELKGNPTEKLYITGHSLGGAVAIITAANLIERGIPANQIKVITFGAPAVGNKGFAEEYKDKIDLERVTVNGDPIKKSLQSLGYVHFGEVTKYKPDTKTVPHFPHMMVVYLDCAIRDYYDEKFKSKSQENNSVANKSNDELIYVAPMQVMEKSFTNDDFKYIKAVMKDQITHRFPSAVYDETAYREVEEVDELADFDNTIEKVLTKAKAANCKKILVQYLQAKKIKNDRDGDYRVSLEEIYYDLNGSPISMQTASVTTKELTILEAAIFAQENLNQK